MAAEHDGVGAFVSAAREALRLGAADRVLSLYAATPGAEASAAAVGLVAVAYARLKRSGEARAAFERAVSLAPKSAATHFNLALFLANSGDLDDAIEENRVALFLQPGHSGAEALRQSLGARMQDRADHGTEGFAVVSAAPGAVSSPSAAFARLPCAMCGAPNFVTARTCQRCGSLLPESDPVIPME